jgi:PhnB protein
MPVLNPYLLFEGTCEEAFIFYKSVFGGEFEMISRFKDIPSDVPMPEIEGDQIMHVALPIGSGSMLMGSDRPANTGKNIIGNNYSISVSADSEKQADLFFKGLAAGGQVTMPIDKTFWGAYFGMLIDKYGINWMISYDYGSNAKA